MFLLTYQVNQLIHREEVAEDGSSSDGQVGAEDRHLHGHGHFLCYLHDPLNIYID